MYRVCTLVLWPKESVDVYIVACVYQDLCDKGMEQRTCVANNQPNINSMPRLKQNKAAKSSRQLELSLGWNPC